MWLQSVMPRGMATTVPTIRPSRIDTRRRFSGANRSIAMITASVKNPMPIAAGSPKSGPVPPPNQPPATRIRDTPMMRMMVPVTNGGKNRISRPNTGASSIMNSPQAITDP